MCERGPKYLAGKRNHDGQIRVCLCCFPGGEVVVVVGDEVGGGRRLLFCCCAVVLRASGGLEKGSRWTAESTHPRLVKRRRGKKTGRRGGERRVMTGFQMPQG